MKNSNRITLLEDGKYIMHVPIREEASDSEKFLAILDTFEKNINKISTMHTPKIYNQNNKNNL